MKRLCFVGIALLAGCSSTSSSPPSGDGGTPDGASADGTVGDGSSATDAPVGDSTGSLLEAAADTGSDSATSTSDAGDAATDGSTGDGACPAPALPSDDPFTLDDGGLDGATVILHAAGAGTQDYTCEGTAVDGGTNYVWSFVGPEANLSDCNAMVVATHFASEGGPGFPEWQAKDGTFVIGQKLQAFTPDGGSGSVPWLVLTAVTEGGPDAGTLSGTLFVERLNTSGGVAPSAGSCNVDAGGTTQKVPYTADYYFIGQ
jgi:hypothetical protein